MSDNIFIQQKNKSKSNNFKDMFGIESTIANSPLPSSLHIQNKIEGNIENHDIRNLLSSEIPTTPSEVDNSITKLFGGGNNSVYSPTSPEYTDNTVAIQNKLTNNMQDTESLQQRFNAIFGISPPAYPIVTYLPFHANARTAGSAYLSPTGS